MTCLAHWEGKDADVNFNSVERSGSMRESKGRPNGRLHTYFISNTI